MRVAARRGTETAAAVTCGRVHEGTPGTEAAAVRVCVGATLIESVSASLQFLHDSLSCTRPSAHGDSVSLGCILRCARRCRRAHDESTTARTARVESARKPSLPSLPPSLPPPNTHTHTHARASAHTHTTQPRTTLTRAHARTRNRTHTLTRNHLLHKGVEVVVEEGDDFRHGVPLLKRRCASHGGTVIPPGHGVPPTARHPPATPRRQHTLGSSAPQCAQARAGRDSQQRGAGGTARAAREPARA